MRVCAGCGLPALCVSVCFYGLAALACVQYQNFGLDPLVVLDKVGMKEQAVKWFGLVEGAAISPTMVRCVCGALVLRRSCV